MFYCNGENESLQKDTVQRPAHSQNAPQNVGNVKDKVALGQKPQHTDK